MNTKCIASMPSVKQMTRNVYRQVYFVHIWRGEKPNDYGLHAELEEHLLRQMRELRIGYSKDTGDESLKMLKMATYRTLVIADCQLN